MNWTPEQEQVIGARDCSLLVSAAAGSGKTAVLVERIIKLVTDGEHPMDIDRMLMMTFTKAAASEMREKISRAIEKKLEEQPDNEHLQLQSTLVHHAQITTIDSFCLNLIRDHFNLLEIDPGFRIGDEGELMLLKKDVMEQMLEEYYEKGDERFERFIDTYASGKADGGIEDYIMQVYTFSQSNPWPRQWMEACIREQQELEEGHLDQTRWAAFLMEDVKLQLGELWGQLKDAVLVCEEEDGLQCYLPTLETELTMLEELLSAPDYPALNRNLKEVFFGRLAAARSKDLDPLKKSYVTGCRDRVKKAVTALKEQYGFEELSEVIEDLKGTRDGVEMLLELAMKFTAKFQESKQDKNIVDFNDLEHFALKILVSYEDGQIRYSPVADELSAGYREILVDEYQDSNYVQEMLLNSLSGERFGRPNVFMVGDVKQSIYRFRLARPELFMEKYETYTPGKGAKRKIELHQNFRSRESVLSSINDVFYSIMTKNLGNIQYTVDTALHPGAVFEPAVQGQEHRIGTPTELLMVNTGRETDRQADEEMAEYTSREIEAKMIAGRIRELMDPEHGLLLWDQKEGRYRSAGYQDMVILLRSVSGWTDSFLNVLTQEGIPACADTSTGYFNTIEVETVLSMLAVIDNPIQDIPLAAVLKSPIAGIADTELAVMMALYKEHPEKGQDRGVYGAFRYCLAGETCADTGEKSPLWQKLKKFDQFLSEMRDEAAYLPIHEVLYRIYTRTGYYDYVAAMPAGEVRRANLDMLAEKASAYEKTSYKGLFHFIRYIGNLKKYDTDFGEASAAGDGKQLVRMMSIHKSKGLEFPIVFLAGMGKAFNKQDVRGKILIDADLGIGTDYFNQDLRLKSTTLKKNVLKRKMDLDSLGEELRILYVGMTRAKEKLIITGTDRYLNKKQEKWDRLPWEQGSLPYTVLTGAGCYLDWLLMSLSRAQAHMVTEEILLEDIVGEEVVRQVQKKVSKEELFMLDLSKTQDEKSLETLQAALSFRYSWQEDVTLHTKMSVSELKKAGQNVDEKDNLYQPVQAEFLGKPAADSGYGASRGTAYHRALELLDFASIDTRADLDRSILRFLEEEKMSKEDYAMLDGDILWGFLSSNLGRRMKTAQTLGRCHKEQQFVMGIPAAEMGLGRSGELVLVQGIIDAYLEEERGLVLIDYKTDHVLPGHEQDLIDRYSRQLDYYQRALEQITGLRVTERLIYSITLQKEILLNRLF